MSGIIIGVNISYLQSDEFLSYFGSKVINVIVYVFCKPVCFRLHEDCVN